MTPWEIINENWKIIADLYPWGAQNIDAFIQQFQKSKEILICVFKTVLENNGADHVAGGSTQDKGGITG